MSEEVKFGDSQDHQDCLEVEKIAENRFKEVLDSMAVKVYGHWIGKGTEKCDLQQNQPKTQTSSARAKLSKSKI